MDPNQAAPEIAPQTTDAPKSQQADKHLHPTTSTSSAHVESACSGKACSVPSSSAEPLPPATESSSSPSHPSSSPSRPNGHAHNDPTPDPSIPPPNPAPTDRIPSPEFARPYCFFPLNNNPQRSEIREPEPIPYDLIVKPDDDPGAIAGIPVFKPSYEEFKQFDVYMEKVRPWGERSSIVKIIPPKEWVEAVELLDKRALSQLEIKSPIEQRMKGQNGVFVQMNVERNRNRPLSIHEWFQKCQSHADLKTPNPKEGDRSVNRDSKEARALIAQRAAEAKAAKQAKKEKAAKRKEERERRTAQKEAEEAGPSQTRGSGTAHGADFASLAPETPAGDTSIEHPDDLPGLDASSHTSHSTGEPLATTPASDPSAEPPLDPFYDKDWKKVWLPDGIEPTDFDVAGCTRIEHKFWKSLGTGKKDSWYGADLAGSLFADEEYPWNVAQLPNLLNRLPDKIPGVNSPYLYFGMWRAAFSWHVEDMDLYSINYIHFGAPKLWYAVPQIQADRFESLVRSYFPTDANVCDQFMRHKSCTVSPSKLHSEGIRVNKMVQHQNEFVITFPRGYHAGFNLGFNCAESVNFALPAWVELGRKAKACTCVDFSVRIDVDLLTGAKKAPEPSPPRETRPRKRKLEEGERTSARRKRKVEQLKQEVEEVPSPSPPPLKVPLRLPLPEKVVSLSPVPKVAIVRDTPPCPCVLCPSLATEDLAPLFRPNDFIRSLSKTTAVQAHTSCAVALPEVWTEEVTISLDSGEDEHTVTYIKGLDDIDKARWKLKCACCVDKTAAKRGTKIQCTKGKCIRAFHIPCAKNNDEVYYYAGPRSGRMESTGAAETDGDDFMVELLCPTHNPAVVEKKKRKAAEELRDRILAIPIGSFVQCKVGGCYFEAQLMEIKEEKKRLVVRLPDLKVKDIGWSALDFRPPREPQQRIENEYAGPPKRSRKDMSAAPMVDSPNRYWGAPYAAPNPAEYYGAPQMFPPANTVRLVDSKLPQPREYHHTPGGFGPMVMDHLRGLPPAMAYGPRVAIPAGRALGYAPPPHRVTPVGPPPLRMMSTNGGAPPTNGSIPVGGWPPQPPQQRQQQPQAPPQHFVPGGVGKIDLGLDRMLALMAKLPPMIVPALHLAGTNGKGSVSVLLEACLKAAGMRTARYNSPHLLEPRDAIRINGQPVSAHEYASAVAHVQRVSDENKLGATIFEIGTAVAFLIANTIQPPVDVMIIECGMGGLRDATNVIPPQLILASGLTSVALDHTDRLGDTIAAIAREKASICVNGGVLVLAPHLHPMAGDTARAVTAERGAHLVQAQQSQVLQPGQPMSLVPFHEPGPTAVRTPLAGASGGALTTELSLGGVHQLDNLSLALTLLDVIRNDARAQSRLPKVKQLTDAALQSGVQSARWEGRCAWLQWNDNGNSIPFLVDGAHNEGSAATLAAYLSSLNMPRPRTFIMSLSASPGKSPESVLAPLLLQGDRVIVTSFTTPVEDMPWIRCTEPEVVAAAAQRLGAQVQIVPGAGVPAVAEALRQSANGNGPAVLCGSLYLVADAYRLLSA